MATNACHSTKCNTIVVMAKNVILWLLGNGYDTIVVTDTSTRWVLWVQSTKCDTILVTVPNVMLCTHQYQMGWVQHYGTILNFRSFTSSNIRQLSCSRYIDVYYHSHRRTRERELLRVYEWRLLINGISIFVGYLMPKPSF